MYSGEDYDQLRQEIESFPSSGFDDPAVQAELQRLHAEIERLQGAIAGYLTQLDEWRFRHGQTPPTDVPTKPAGYEGALRKLRWAQGGD